MTYLSLIYAILFYCSCSNDSNVNCKINHIDPKYEHYKSIVDNSTHSFIFGTSGGSQDYRKKETVIYKKYRNGDFKLLSVKAKGECKATTIEGKYVYLINEIFTKKLSFSGSKSILFKLNIESNELDKVSEIGNIHVKEIFFDNDSVGYLFVRLSNYARDGGLLKTINGGISWDTLKLGKPIQRVQSKKEKFYFLSYKRNDKSDWIYSIDKENSAIDSLQFELNITDFYVDDNGSYWLLGNDGDKTVLQCYQEGKITDVHTFSNDPNYFSKRLYKFNDVVVVLAGQVDKNLLGGFGGTQPLMYLSKDGGLTWTTQSFANALYIKPISFYKGEQITAYIGHGKVLSCSLK